MAGRQKKCVDIAFAEDCNEGCTYVGTYVTIFVQSYLLTLLQIHKSSLGRETRLFYFVTMCVFINLLKPIYTYSISKHCYCFF
jgi:hypothetical protein